MIRFVLVDDNECQLKYLSQKLALIPGMHLEGSFVSSAEALEFLQNHTVDVAFLDIEMPGLSGMELVKQLNKAPLIIFVSSFPHFAIDSYELDAIDYLLKPVSTDRLLLSIKKAERLLEQLQQSNHEIKPSEQAFFIKDGTTYVKIHFDELLYVQSQNNFVILFLQNGKKHLVLVNLKQFEEQVPDTLFVRISRTHIVNKSKVTAFDHQSVKVQHIDLGIGTTYQHLINGGTFGLPVIKRNSGN